MRLIETIVVDNSDDLCRSIIQQTIDHAQTYEEALEICKKIPVSCDLKTKAIKKVERLGYDKFSKANALEDLSQMRYETPSNYKISGDILLKIEKTGQEELANAKDFETAITIYHQAPQGSNLEKNSFVKAIDFSKDFDKTMSAYYEINDRCLKLFTLYKAISLACNQKETSKATDSINNIDTSIDNKLVADMTFEDLMLHYCGVIADFKKNEIEIMSQAIDLIKTSSQAMIVYYEATDPSIKDIALSKAASLCKSKNAAEFICGEAPDGSNAKRIACDKLCFLNAKV
jgi:hypothetical protein